MSNKTVMHLRRLDFFFIKDDIISLIWSCRRKYLLIRLGLGTSTFSSQIITKNYFLVVSCVKWLDIKIQFIIYNYYLQKDYKLSWISWKSKCLFDMGNRLGHKPLFFFFFFIKREIKIASDHKNTTCGYKCPLTSSLPWH